MSALRYFLATVILVVGAFLTVVGIGWVTQIAFEPSYDTKDSTWTMVGLVLLLIPGVLLTTTGAMVLWALRLAARRKVSPQR
jgi:hypothetical protein